ncbi:hypothetical protein QBC46DRAFT_409487 [Diplogelasinospora grovesii]|uniref:Uncharacterized protein n=1 Tax=Diplogelasinospora grovesii TaxID=303347 RepID=A0AAN6N4X0_9PEZI|nr:hypothetical protein QBC46DRAFT_409487 [Diplogelasinospora grovesii]
MSFPVTCNTPLIEGGDQSHTPDEATKQPGQSEPTLAQEPTNLPHLDDTLATESAFLHTGLTSHILPEAMEKLSLFKPTEITNLTHLNDIATSEWGFLNPTGYPPGSPTQENSPTRYKEFQARPSRARTPKQKAKGAKQHRIRRERLREKRKPKRRAKTAKICRFIPLVNVVDNILINASLRKSGCGESERQTSCLEVDREEVETRWYLNGDKIFRWVILK